MPRQGGLGPLGHQAIQRASQEARHPRAPVITEPARGNPSVTTHTDPGELQVSDAGLQWWDFDSSRVNQAAYDAANQRLFVNFQRPTPGQDEYVYEGVSPNEFRNFRRSASPGKYVNRVLNQKNYHRVN